VQIVRYEKYIDDELRKTRRQVRLVDLTWGALALLVGTLVYLFAVALIDQWVVTGGMGTVARTVALAIYLGGAIGWTAWAVAPLLFRKINPVYAAKAIDQSRPSLKNGLVNFLMLRGQTSGISPAVFAQIEKQAATGLSQTPLENAVDRSHLLKLAYVLLGTVAVLAIYKIASPKDPIRSVRRVLAPWADIAPPTRVRILDVEPGPAKAFHDHFVKVTAEITGLRRDEQPQVFYSTADGQLVAQSVPMNLPSGDHRHAAELPPSQGGLQQDMEYWIVAGDTETAHYPIRVLTTPSIIVEKIEYRYPRYTEVAPETVARQGDISAIEGTEVVITATANEDIKSAHVDFECDGSRDLAMAISGHTATVAFPLTLNKGTSDAEHASYQIRFVTTDGDENPQPVRHKIDVIKDRPPEITFTEPVAADDKVQTIQQDQALNLVIHAADPDYKLSDVRVVAEVNGKPLVSKALMPAPQMEFSGPFLLGGKQLGLKPGDAIEYWAEAKDNKSPTANAVATSKRKLRVAALDGKRDGARQEGGVQNPDGKGDPNQDRQQNPQQPNDPKNGTQKPGGRDQREQPKPGDAQNPGEDPPAAPPAKEDPNADRDRVNNPQPDDANPEREPDPKNAKAGQRDPKQERNQEQPNADEAGAQPNDTDTQQEPGKDGQARQEEPKKVDGKADPGKAMQKILDRIQQEKQENPRPEDAAKDNPQDNPQPQEQAAKEKQKQQEKQNKTEKEQQEQGSDGGESEGDGQGENGEGADPEGAAGKGDKGKGAEGKGAEGKGAEGKGENETGNPASKPGADQQNPGEAANDNPGAQPKAQRPQPGKDPAKNPSGNNQEQNAPGKNQPGEKRADDAANPKDKNNPGGVGERNEDNPPQGKPEEGADQGLGKEKDGQAKEGQAKEGQAKGADEGAQGADGGAGADPKDGAMPKDAGAKGEGTATDGQKGQPGQPPNKNTGSKPDDAASGEPGKQPGAENATQPSDGNEPASDGSESGDNAKDDPTGKPSKQTPKSAAGAKYTDKPKNASKDDPLAPADAARPDGAKPEANSAEPDKEPREGNDPSEKTDASGAPKPQPGATKPGKSDQRATDQQPGKKSEKPGNPSQENKDASASNPKQQGKTGGGAKDPSSKGSPKPTQEDNGKAPESKNSEANAQKPSADPQSPANNIKNQSNTKGQEGDQAGAGGRGGGKKSDGAGTGSAGQNTEAEDGGGRGQTSGDGETANRPGDKQPGQAEKGGAPSDQAGAGSTTRAGEQKQTGTTTAKQQTTGPAGAGEGTAGGAEGVGEAQSNPTGGAGMPGTDGAAQAPPRQETQRDPTEDEANLEYAKKATDLAVEYLKDQLAKGKPDQELLDDLQWTREDMDSFVRQWDRFKKQENSADPAERKQFEERLEDLGLRPRGTALKGGRVNEQRTPVLRDKARSEPPPEYRQQYRVFSSGGAKGRQPAGK